MMMSTGVTLSDGQPAASGVTVRESWTSRGHESVRPLVV